jgi:TusA-related sulfurtransferase
MAGKLVDETDIGLLGKKMNHEDEIIEFDIRGQVCPSCLLLVLREINNRNQPLIDGQCQMLVLTDNRDAISTIPAAVESMGLSANVNKVDDYYQILINRKKQG